MGTQGRFIETNALIDQGSDKTFVDERLVEWLEIPSKDVTYNVTSVHQHKVPLKGKEVSLTIESIDRSKGIKVDKVWTMGKIPFKVENRLGKKELANFPHLSDLDLPTITSKEVRIIIGSDVTDVTVPYEVRRGKAGEPCAQKCVFGWSIVGPIHKCSDTKDSEVNFLRTEVLELSKSVEHMKIIKTNERVGMSVEDKSALGKVELSQRVSKDGHYDVSLSLHDKEFVLPNNKCLEVESFQCLRNTPVKIQPTNENLYLSYGSVTNSNDAQDISVVCKYSCTNKDNCLNKYLLQFTEAVSDVVRVQKMHNETAKMAEIEKVYYQVRVHKNNKEVFRLLWWPGGGQGPICLDSEENTRQDRSVRSCKIRMSKSDQSRPISKLCLLEYSSN
jgi:hypothetical protein